MSKCYHIEFEVIKEIGNIEFSFEITPGDFLELIDEAERKEGFRLETTGDGIKCMIEDEAICEMIIWEMEHVETKQQEEANI